MKNIRWAWPVLVLGVALLLPWGCYRLRPVRPLDIVVVDKTVPFVNRIEHRSLYWLLGYLKVVRPGGEAYDRDRDYLGAFPGPVPGDPPERTRELSAEVAAAADLLYLVDTYGVYEKDLESGSEMKAALERSPKIYGGLLAAEAEAVARAVDRGVTVVAEFNTFASPTAASVRERMEELLGVRWTRWIGRYFARLEDEEEVPRWLREVYEREWRRPWEFRGAGYVLTRDDVHCEVLEIGAETQRTGLTLERERPIDRLLASAHDGVAYSYWFDLVEAAPGAQILAWFQWHLTPQGEQRLRARRLPTRFPAVIRSPSGNAYYLAGDFADNPMPDATIPVAGYLDVMKTVERFRLAPSVQSFYWRFYVPLMRAVLDEVDGGARSRSAAALASSGSTAD